MNDGAVPADAALVFAWSRVDTDMPSTNWVWWALLSACFAALTAIFAKVGLAGVNPDFATLVRTWVIVAALTVFVTATGAWSNPGTLAPKTLLFLTASGLATGASWVCYFRALQLGRAYQVAPVDKLSLLLVAAFAFVFLGERPSPREWFGMALVGVGVILLALRK